MLSLTTIAQTMNEAPNWWREYYTIGLLSFLFGGAMLLVRTCKPLFDAYTKSQEERTTQEGLRLQTAQSVERTAQEVRNTVAESGRVTVAQAEVTKAQASMTENLIRLQERVRAGADGT